MAPVAASSTRYGNPKANPFASAKKERRQATDVGQLLQSLPDVPLNSRKKQHTWRRILSNCRVG